MKIELTMPSDRPLVVMKEMGYHTSVCGLVAMATAFEYFGQFGYIFPSE